MSLVILYFRILLYVSSCCIFPNNLPFFLFEFDYSSLLKGTVFCSWYIYFLVDNLKKNMYYEVK